MAVVLKLRYIGEDLYLHSGSCFKATDPIFARCDLVRSVLRTNASLEKY